MWFVEYPYFRGGGFFGPQSPVLAQTTQLVPRCIHVRLLIDFFNPKRSFSNEKGDLLSNLIFRFGIGSEESLRQCFFLVIVDFGLIPHSQAAIIAVRQSYRLFSQ